MAGLGIQQGVDRHIVGPSREGVQRDPFHVQGREPGVIDIGITGDDVRFQGRHTFGEGATDIAQAHNTDRFTMQ